MSSKMTQRPSSAFGDRFSLLLSLTEQDDAVRLRVEELAVHVADAAAGTAMDHNHRLALGVAARHTQTQTQAHGVGEHVSARSGGLPEPCNQSSFKCAIVFEPCLLIIDLQSSQPQTQHAPVSWAHTSCSQARRPRALVSRFTAAELTVWMSDTLMVPVL